MEPVDRSTDHGSRPDLVVAGFVKGAADCDLDLTVAIETVVADDEIPEILTMYTTTTHTNTDGRFVDRYDVPDNVRDRLHGWVMCTVLLHPLVPGAFEHCKVVRWQRQSSDELIAGLCALLATVSFEVGLSRSERQPDGDGATIRRAA